MPPALTENERPHALETPCMKLHAKIALLAVTTLAVPLALALVLFKDILAQKNSAEVERQLLATAQTVAAAEEAQQFLRGFSHSGLESLVRDTVDASSNLTRLTVFDLQTARFAYPEPVGDAPELVENEAAFAGGEARVVALEETPGTQVRALTPVNDQGVLKGYVLAETTMSMVLSRRRQVILTLALCCIGGLAAAVAGSAYLARKTRRALLGLEPEEIAGGYNGYVSMMETLHEGVVAIDSHGMISMSNRAAKRLLGMKGRDLNARHIKDIMPDTRLLEVLASGKPEYNREQQVHGRVLIVNRVPIVENGTPVGAVVIFQDKSQVVQLAEELTGARQLVDTLRAASHEFRNKTHVILGLLERGHVERAKQYIIDIQQERVELNKKLVHSFKDPVVSGLILAKCISCGEQGVRLDIDADSNLEPIGNHDLNHALVTIAGNLIDNAMESARNNADGKGRIVLKINEQPGHIDIEVADNGPGIEAELLDKIFVRGFSTKGDGHGIGLYLVREVTESAGGRISVKSSPRETLFAVVLPK